MQEHYVAKLKSYFLPTGEQDGQISNTHHSFVLIINLAKKKEMNTLKDHQVEKNEIRAYMFIT